MEADRGVDRGRSTLVASGPAIGQRPPPFTPAPPRAWHTAGDTTASPRRPVLFDLQGWINRIAGSRRWSRAGAHLVVVALVAFSAAGAVMGARAQDLVAGSRSGVESAAFPFNLVALAQAAEDSSAPLSPLILHFDPTTYEDPLSREGELARLATGAEAVGPMDVATAADVAAAAASADADGNADAVGDAAPVVSAPLEQPPVVAAPEVPVQLYTGAMLGWPVVGGTISQGYWPGHLGVDIAAPWGSAVVASGNGTVTYAGWRDNGGGYVVEIVHDNGLITVYNHLSSIWVWPGQYVGWGQGIGAIGCSGLCYGPHLHFAVFSGYVPVNPLRYL